MTLHQGAKEHLRQFVEQIERLEEEKKALADEIKDKFAEAKAVGFDVKALRRIIALRKKSEDELTDKKPFWRPISTPSAWPTLTTTRSSRPQSR